ncbi:hypothetical protein A2U01_0113030, partial [Trifolium medium]|nr:hypothetical protein [Trifolium medium]
MGCGLECWSLDTGWRGADFVREDGEDQRGGGRYRVLGRVV